MNENTAQALTDMERAELLVRELFSEYMRPPQPTSDQPESDPPADDQEATA